MIIHADCVTRTIQIGTSLSRAKCLESYRVFEVESAPPTKNKPFNLFGGQCPRYILHRRSIQDLLQPFGILNRISSKIIIKIEVRILSPFFNL